MNFTHLMSCYVMNLKSFCMLFSQDEKNTVPSKSQTVYGISQECCTWFHLISGLIPLPLLLNHFFIFGSVKHARQFGRIDHKNSQRMIRITDTINDYWDIYGIYLDGPFPYPTTAFHKGNLSTMDSWTIPYCVMAIVPVLEKHAFLWLSFIKPQEKLCDLFNATCNRLGINANTMSAARCHKTLLAMWSCQKKVIQNYL